MDRYSTEVQARFQLTVPVFEELIRQGLLEENSGKLVTDGSAWGLPNSRMSSATRTKK